MQYISLSSTSDKFRILQCEYTTQIKHIKKQYYMRKFRRQCSISAIIISGWFLMLNFYDNFSYLSQYSTYTLIFHHSNFTNSSFCQSDSGILCTTWIIYCPDIFKDVFFFFGILESVGKLHVLGMTLFITIIIQQQNPFQSLLEMHNFQPCQIC